MKAIITLKELFDWIKIIETKAECKNNLKLVNGNLINSEWQIKEIKQYFIISYKDWKTISDLSWLPLFKKINDDIYIIWIDYNLNDWKIDTIKYNIQLQDRIS